MEFKVVLNKEEVLKLCEKDKNFEICIQKAALNYLRNNRLKPLMKEEIVREIEEYKRNLRSHVRQAMEEMGVSEDSGWNNSYVLLSDKIKKKIKEEVAQGMSEFIATEVKGQLNVSYEKTKKEIVDWEKAIKFRIDTELTPAKIKTIAREILEHKISLLN